MNLVFLTFNENLLAFSQLLILLSSMFTLFLWSRMSEPSKLFSVLFRVVSSAYVINLNRLLDRAICHLYKLIPHCSQDCKSYSFA